MKKGVFKIIIFVLSFLIAGIVDNFINERTFQTFTAAELRALPLSFYFLAYQIIFIAAGFGIIYKLRKKSVDLLTLPAWLTGFDMVSLIFNGERIFGQTNWRAEIWGYPASFFGESLLTIPIGYWFSLVFLLIYLVIMFNPKFLKKLKIGLNQTGRPNT
jgi:hypothetical protein